MSRRRKLKSGGSESSTLTIDKSKKYKWDSKGDYERYCRHER